MPFETIEIDGRQFWTLAEFYDYIGPRLYDDDWGRNLDAFNDILRGGPVTLRWTHSALSRGRLGAKTFDTLVEIIRVHGKGGAESTDGVELILE